ncbi:MAG: TetR/AcrR family transcriptional regulator [Actinomycetota bacterium]
MLAVAREQLAGIGYEAMSLAAIAANAGTTRQALYRRWPTKADLATAAIASMSGHEDRPDSDDPLADLVAELAAFRRGVTRRNGVSLVGTMLQNSADPELVRLFRARLVAPRRTRITHILTRAQAMGKLAPDADIEFATAAATGVLYAQALSGSPARTRWADRAAALVWRACGGTPPA